MSSCRDTAVAGAWADCRRASNGDGGGDGELDITVSGEPGGDDARGSVASMIGRLRLTSGPACAARIGRR